MRNSAFVLGNPEYGGCLFIISIVVTPFFFPQPEHEKAKTKTPKTASNHGPNVDAIVVILPIDHFGTHPKRSSQNGTTLFLALQNKMMQSKKKKNGFKEREKKLEQKNLQIRKGPQTKLCLGKVQIMKKKSRSKKKQTSHITPPYTSNFHTPKNKHFKP
jgi:hypothetical protein